MSFLKHVEYSIQGHQIHYALSSHEESLETLPKELVLFICSFLPETKDVSHLSQTCKRFYRLLNNIDLLKDGREWSKIYNEKLQEYVEFNIKRPPILEEIQPLESELYNFVKPFQKRKILDDSELTKKVNDFHDIFLTHCHHLKITPSSQALAPLIQKIQRQLRLIASQMHTSDSHLVSIKIETFIHKLNKRIFNFLIFEFSHLPLEAITIKSYKDKVAQIQQFSHYDPAVIEYKLRNSIWVYHRNDDFNAIFEIYTTTNHHTLTRIKTMLQETLGIEKATIEKEIAELQKEIKRMTKIKNSEEAEFNQAILQAKRKGDAALTQLVCSTGLSHLLNHKEFNINYVHPTAIDLAIKKYNLEQTQREMHHLVNRLNELAQYEPDTHRLIGGRLAQVNAHLMDPALETQAKKEMQKIEKFYIELNKFIAKRDQNKRYEELHSLI